MYSSLDPEIWSNLPIEIVTRIWKMYIKHRHQRWLMYRNRCNERVCDKLCWRICEVRTVSGIFSNPCEKWCRGKRGEDYYVCKLHGNSTKYHKCKCGRTTRLFSIKYV